MSHDFLWKAYHDAGLTPFRYWSNGAVDFGKSLLYSAQVQIESYLFHETFWNRLRKPISKWTVMSRGQISSKQRWIWVLS